jgi:hypothetical protein
MEYSNTIYPYEKLDLEGNNNNKYIGKKNLFCMRVREMESKNFDGDTFVAFLDISGFKRMMDDKSGKAWEALDLLYNTGYEILRDQNNEEVSGIFISDSGILYSNNKLKIDLDPGDALIRLLTIIKKINEVMLRNGFMLTTSISYGEFKYQDRIVIPNVKKSAVYGGAYVKAYLDNEHGNPKIKPGQCRIIRDGLPDRICRAIREKSNRFNMIQKHKPHYYYYWMCHGPNDIKEFDSNYEKAYECRYKKLCEVLKDNSL